MNKPVELDAIQSAAIRELVPFLDENELNNLLTLKFVLDVHSIVGITDASGKIIYANDKFCEISGYAKTEILGRDHNMLNSGYHPKSFWVNAWKTIAAGKIWHAEVANRSKGGELYWVDTTIIPIIGSNKKPEKYVSIRTDISARKRVEESVLIARDAAEAANKAKSEFLSMIGHEIQMPMNGVGGMVDMLMATNLTPEQQNYASIIKECSDSLSDIINDIIDFNSMDRKSVIENEDFSPALLAKSVYSLMFDRAVKKGLDIKLEVKSNVPRYVHGDAGKVRQVLLSLVSNAIKFTNSGYVNIAVSEVFGDSPRLFLEVVDTGVGIPESEYETIFQPMSGSNKKDQGIGLGLPSAKRMLDQLGGTIQFESNPRDGTRFTATVPVEHARHLSHFSGKVPERPRVLVVSQNEELYGIAARNLQDVMEVEESSNWRGAINSIMAAANLNMPFQVVIVDAELQDTAPFEFASMIQGLRDIHHPRLVLAGNISYNMNKRALTNGFVACLRRPFKDTEFKAYVSGITDPSTIKLCQSKFQQDDSQHNILIGAPEIETGVVSEIAARHGFNVYTAVTASDVENAMESINFSIAILSMNIDGMETVIRRSRKREIKLGMAAAPIIAITEHGSELRERYMDFGINDIIQMPLANEKIKAVISKWAPNKDIITDDGDEASIAEEFSLVEATDTRLAHAGANPVSTVLIVDDDKATRKMLRKFLESDSCIVNEAQSGAEAISMCKRSPPDIVLMDSNMPVIDGFNATSAIKSTKKGRDIHVLVMTSMNDEVSANRAMSVGASDFVQKPVYLPVLRQRLKNIMSMKEAQRHVVHLAYHDRLTGLPNRIMFDDRIGRAVAAAKRNDSKVAIMFMDLDRFKNVNDSLGHLAGDELLKQAAVRMSGVLRDQDTLARMGGDEFTVLLPDVGRVGTASMPSTARRVAQRIIEVMNKPFHIEGHDVHVGVSIGIAVAPDDGDDPSALLKQADTALYSSKENGRNNFTFYSSQMHESVAERVRLENGMRKALDRGDFRVFYQPQVSLKTGCVMGLEALARWEFKGEFIPPQKFISVAEDTGLVTAIGEFVLEEACRCLTEFNRRNNTNLAVSVNLSPQQFTRGNLADTVMRIIAKTGINPELLDLEITESLAMKNLTAVQTTLLKLKEVGVRVSMDDFGTGYCSLSYLKKFPIDILKIDKSFISDVIDDPNDAAIVEAIIAMSKALNLTVIAEGVETQAQLEYLQDLHCDCAQGYLQHKPAPFQELEPWILAHGVI